MDAKSVKIERRQRASEELQTAPAPIATTYSMSLTVSGSWAEAVACSERLWEKKYAQ
jgi:hypothetical protein